MWTRQKKRRSYGRLIVPMLTVCFCSYFSYHSINGGFGLRAQQRMAVEKVALETELAGLTAERQKLEKRALLLSDGSIERDMLDAQVRRALNMTRPDEIVIVR